MTQTLDEFISKLQYLREITGGDVPVAITSWNNGEAAFSQAAAEIQNVLPWSWFDDVEEERWVCDYDSTKNTKQIIAIH